MSGVLAVLDATAATIGKLGAKGLAYAADLHEARAAVAELMQTAHALGPLISEAVAASKPGLYREDAIKRRDNFYAALARVQGGQS